MDIWVLDQNFRNVCNIDTFESLIWTERYVGFGNFELYTLVDKRLLEMVKQDFYIWLKDSEQVMIVESIQIQTEVETGGHLTISGRSLESILDRRIIWKQTVLNSNVQTAIQKLLNENAINPSDSSRKIPGLIFESTIDSAITSLNVQAQYTGDNLYDTIEAICKSCGIGFKITLNSSNQFVFKLYAGTDHSYIQSTNPYVIFSPKYENIINSNYLESKKTLKNVTLVAGEDDENKVRKTLTVGSGSGLARRELFTDARDIQSEVDNRTLTPEEYNAQLQQRGLEKLAENPVTKSFEGQVEATQTFVYGEDFYKGDIVQIVNEYGIQSTVRVTEVVRCQDTTGYEMYPTFSIMEEEES